MKRDQDIDRKAVFSDVKTAFNVYPRLNLLTLPCDLGHDGLWNVGN